MRSKIAPFANKLKNPAWRPSLASLTLSRVTEASFFLNSISRLAGFHPFWIPRLAQADVRGDRDFALRNLAPHHDSIITQEYPPHTRHHAEQVHGNRIAIISRAIAAPYHLHHDVDGLITNLPKQLLGIYVADCAAIYLADPKTKSIALLHSGKKGTEGNILAVAANSMEESFGTNTSDLICVVSPCIRPPHYEIDLATIIAQQAEELGITSFHDSLQNTATDLNSHYSYRIEKGQTGRMLALFSIELD